MVCNTQINNRLIRRPGMQKLCNLWRLYSQTIHVLQRYNIFLNEYIILMFFLSLAYNKNIRLQINDVPGVNL